MIVFHLCRAVFVVALCGCTLDALAHPGSGIVVDEAGSVYFTYSSRGVAKIDPEGRFSIIYDNRGGHWMCLDQQGAFASTQPQFFQRVTPNGAVPALIYADGGAPIAVSRDGYLYYAAGHSGSETDPGGLAVARFKPDGKPELFGRTVRAALARLDEGVTGLTIAPDDTLLIASPSSVWRLKKDGSLVTVASPVTVQNCNGLSPPHGARLQLRGLDATDDGGVYVAATGCRQVIRIEADGQTNVALQSQAPWTPTGVAVHKDELYVLEYTNANGGVDEGWRPRVRRVASNGPPTTLFEARDNIPVRP